MKDEPIYYIQIMTRNRNKGLKIVQVCRKRDMELKKKLLTTHLKNLIENFIKYQKIF